MAQIGRKNLTTVMGIRYNTRQRNVPCPEKFQKRIYLFLSASYKQVNKQKEEMTMENKELEKTTPSELNDVELEGVSGGRSNDSDCIEDETMLIIPIV